MSHFTVLVVAKDESELDDRLVPYYEYGTSTEHDRRVQPYLEWVNIEEEYRNEYETDSVEMILMPDGRKLSAWDDTFRIPGQYGIGTGTHEAPASLPRVQVSHKERYATFEQFMADWGGYKHERGNMGWWAIVADENNNYAAEFWSVVNRLAPDARVYVVDCHI